MSPFLPLESLKKIISSCTSDLRQVRLINSQLQQKVKEVRNREGYRVDYVNREVAKLTAEAKEGAALYLEAEKTLQNLTTVSEQSDSWSVSAYLARASAVPSPALLSSQDPSSTVTLLKTLVALQRVTNALMSSQRMHTQALVEAAQAALNGQDWGTLGTIFNELTYRVDKGGDAMAAGVKGQIESATVPDVKEAQSLITEGAELRSLVDFTLRSITNGEEDLGLQLERFAQVKKEQNGNKPGMRKQIEDDRQAAASGTYKHPAA